MPPGLCPGPQPYAGSAKGARPFGIPSIACGRDVRGAAGFFGLKANLYFPKFSFAGAPQGPGEKNGRARQGCSG
ncbi:hypothetical protein D7X33_02780 [Butyricicoccus sp. 1XD8-22]|nr:hypothetical protein D7X33_02780 [Butyricicoccus sp. 1XD8-22]